MLVAITRAMFEASKKKFEAAPFYLSQDKFRWKDEQNINLARHKPDAVNLLAEILDGLAVPGAKVVARDCRNWLAAIESGGKETKLRRVRQFPELFRLFFKTNGRRRLYVRESDNGVEAAMLAYYIVNCVYHPKNDRTESPEHVTLTLAYERFGKTRTSTVRYDAGEVLNKTIPEIMIESGYVVEDDKTREDYEHEADRYDALRDDIGKQINCVGVASDYEIDGNSYRDDWWRPYRPEVWIEKDALVGVLEVACEPWHVPYFSCRGYVSDSEIWSAAQRFRETKRDGQRPLVFHLGDHDPSGIDMTRDITDRLALFAGFDVEVRRLALTMEQVEEHEPPPNPAKVTDSRYQDYADKYGEESWELDALDPETLSALIRDNIEPVIQAKKWKAAERERDDGREQLSKASDQWGDVVAFLEDQE